MKKKIFHNKNQSFMTTLAYRSSRKRVYEVWENPIVRPSIDKLVDAIFSKKKHDKMVVKPNCYIFMSSEGKEKIIRLKHK